MEVYATNFDVQSKDDESPLTQADLASNRCIVAGLEALQPRLPIITEEAGLPDFEERRSWARYWLIDPLDGTKEFVKRNGEFTVNIALIEGDRPTLGVVYAPVLDRLYYGTIDNGAWRQDGNAAATPIQVVAKRRRPARVAGSRSHAGDSLKRFLDKLGEHELVSMGSSLKLCLVAEGEADIYPRLGPTSEWDTAAAQAVVEAAGGCVTTLDLEPLKYNTKDSLLNPYFLVFGDQTENWEVYL
jgi:3'(2'), 5'-bisphosphate nucleotidase